MRAENDARAQLNTRRHHETCRRLVDKAAAAAAAASRVGGGGGGYHQRVPGTLRGNILEEEEDIVNVHTWERKKQKEILYKKQQHII